MNRAELFLRKHSSTILTVIGAAGVVGTSVLAVRATPKALRLLDEAKQEKGEDLTPVEVVKAAWKPYIPAAIVGVSTITCIFGANYLNTRAQASLMSAYALLDSSYKEYQNKVKELHGEESEINVEHELIKSKFMEGVDLSDNRQLFYEHNSMQFFQSTIENVMRAENEFLESVEYRRYGCLNEYLDLLGIPRVPFGYQQGWFLTENNDPYNCHELEFEYDKFMVTDDIECWAIKTNVPPAMDYIF